MPAGKPTNPPASTPAWIAVNDGSVGSVVALARIIPSSMPVAHNPVAPATSVVQFHVASIDGSNVAPGRPTNTDADPTPILVVVTSTSGTVPGDVPVFTTVTSSVAPC